LDTNREAALGVHEIEGYLYWEAGRSEAEHKARAFAQSLPGLSEEQRTAVAEAYAREQVGNHRAVTEHIARRAREIEAKWQARQRTYCRSLTLTFVMVAVGLIGMCASMILASYATP
jgi:hypothetical protein